LEKFGKQFPGFEREVHGIEIDAEGDYWMRSVIESPAEAHPADGKSTAPQVRTRKRKAKPSSAGS
jgi:arginine decarboxylase